MRLSRHNVKIVFRQSSVSKEIKRNVRKFHYVPFRSFLDQGICLWLCLHFKQKHVLPGGRITSWHLPVTIYKNIENLWKIYVVVNVANKSLSTMTGNFYPRNQSSEVFNIDRSLLTMPEVPLSMSLCFNSSVRGQLGETGAYLAARNFGLLVVKYLKVSCFEVKKSI